MAIRSWLFRTGLGAGKLLFLLSVMLVGVPEPVSARVVACGQLINGTIEVMTANLYCPAGQPVRLTGAHPGIDLNGFTLDGGGTGAIGVEILPATTFPVIFNGTIRGFTTCISGGVPMNNGLFETVDVDVLDVRLRDCSAFGIKLVNTPLARIDGVEIRNSRTGIHLEDANGSFIANSIIRKAGIAAIQVVDLITDIDLTSTSYVLVRDTTIENARIGVGATEAAVYVLRSTITGCATCNAGVSANLNAFTNLVGVGGLQVHDSAISKFRQSGVAVTGTFQSATVEVVNTTIRQIGGQPAQAAQGILFDHLALPSATSNRIRSINGGFGIAVYCTGIGALTYNDIRSADLDGILVSEQGSPIECPAQAYGSHLIEGNLAQDNGGTGIFVFSGDHNRVIGNTTRRNLSRGTVVLQGSDHTVQGNVSNANGLAGFELFDVYGTLVESNRARGNGGDGFLLLTGISTTVTGNTSRRNTGWGFATTTAVTDGGGNSASLNTAGQCNPAHISC